MSQSRFKLDEFISSVRSGGLARVNRFEVLITSPIAANLTGMSEKVSLYCEVSNFPPLMLNVKPFKIFGPTYQRPITSEYGGDGISMNFHVDREMRVKRYFEDWLEFIVDRNNFTVAYQNEYKTTMKIRQLDEQNNVTYEIDLIDAFPRSISLMELSNSAQNQTHRLNVLFSYRYWRRTDIPANENPTTLTPPKRFTFDPVIEPIKSTPFSEALESVNSNDGSVDYASGATGGSVAP